MSTVVRIDGILRARYRPVQVLSEGPGRIALLAFDVDLNRHVVARVIEPHALSPEACARLLRESETQRTLQGPWTAPMIDVSYDTDRLCIITPYTLGITLQQRLRVSPLTVPESLTVLGCVLGSLAAVHEHGLVHGAVEPRNLIVDEATPIQGATLMGFEDVHCRTLTEPPSARYIESARYMSPEQAGVITREVDSRSDLYAVGVLAYECLAGQPPFGADDIGELLRQHLSRRPPALWGSTREVPRSLDELVQRLLHKDPDDRYQSARGVLSDLELITAALNSGIEEPQVVVGAHDLRHALTEPALVGREAELELLGRQLRQVRSGRGQLVMVEAESGGGKTRLLDEFCHHANSDGMWVLRGQGVDRTAPRPLQVMTGVALDILQGVRNTPHLADRIRARLGDHALPISRMLPELAEVLEVPSPRMAVHESDGQALGIQGLVALLDTLGSADRPAVVVLDDSQWMDELSIRVLKEWVHRDSRPEQVHVLIVVAARQEDLTAGHPLRELGPSIEMRLQPLHDDQIRQVVESMAGRIPPGALADVVTVSAGSPFMVVAVLRGLVESGALVAADDGWRLEPSPEGAQASRRAAEFLARRLELLSQDSRHLLASGAVLGREFDVRFAALLAGQSEIDAERAATHAEQRHVVWRSDSHRLSFVHDRLREAFLSGLDSHELTHLHRRAAEMIESDDPTRAFELSYHFDAGGLPDRALPYAMIAAEAARSQDDLELAERQYRIAERGAEHGECTSRQEVALSLGRVLMLRGHYDEARDRLETALNLATQRGDSSNSARIHGELGELAFKQDEIEAARRWIEQALRMLGESTPRRPGPLIFRVCWNLLLRLFGRANPLRRSRRPDANLAAHLYARLLYVWYFSERASLFTLWVLLRQVSTAERCPPGRERAHAYGLYAGVIASTFPPLWRKALRYVDRARDMHEQRHDQWGQGHALSMRALVLCAAGRFAEAQTAAGRAMRLLRRSGDPWELYWAAMHNALCLYRLGDLPGAIEQAQATHAAAVALGDRQAEATTLEVWAKASNGRLDAEPIEAALRDAGADVQTRTALLQAQALQLRGQGRLADAIHSAEQAVGLTRRARAMNMYLVAALPWLATLYREAVEEGSAIERTRRRLIRRARRATRRSLRYSLVYRNERPHALREAAMIASLSGHTRRGRWLFSASVSAAEKRGARAELAETLRLRAKMGYELAWAGAADDLARSIAIREEIDPTDFVDLPRVTLGLAQRFDALLTAGGPLVSAGSLDEIATAVEEAVRLLLRPEHDAVIGFGGRAVNFTQTGSPDWSAGQTLVQRAFESRRPVVLAENPTGDQSGDTAALASPRSALCAPIVVGDEVLGYLLASHSRVAGVFGDEEIRLAQFIAHLAGAALEREHLRDSARARIIAAQEAERARVARDLHDEIGQGITSVLLGINRIHMDLEIDALDRSRLLGQTEETRIITAEVLDRVQRLAFELRPTVLDDLGLVAALRRLTEDASSRHGLAIDLALSHLTDSDRLSPELETTVYRIAQEALTNVARHARVSSCSVVLARVHDRIRLVVSDNGVGFEPAVVSEGSLGLTGMAERAALVSGVVKINSSRETGTVVVMEAPLD